MERAVLDNFEHFCNQLAVPTPDAGLSQNGWSKPKDMAQLMGYLAFDVMGDICFGRNFGTLTSPKNRDLIGAISDGAQGLNTVSRRSLSSHVIYYVKLV